MRENAIILQGGVLSAQLFIQGRLRKGMKATADLVDDYGDILQSSSIQFRDLGGRTRFFGPIRTLQCCKDNQLLKSLMSQSGQGAVLVVDGAGSLEAALLGDMIATLGMNNGWSGCVIHGAVRDSVILATLDFGVKALGVNPVKSSKIGEGEIGGAIEFGGVRFEPGQWIYCDEDGLVVAPNELSV
jgi:regulator of ribonuclease activity A